MEKFKTEKEPTKEIVPIKKVFKVLKFMYDIKNLALDLYHVPEVKDAIDFAIEYFVDVFM